MLFLCEMLVVLIAVTVGLVAYQKWRFKYWERKNVPFLQPSLIFGNVENTLARKHPISIQAKLMYDEFKSRGCKYGGIYFFTTPIYLPTHPEVLKSVMLKDFDCFVDRGFYHDEENDPLSAHLFAIGGQKWRNLRTKLTPTFTSGKMRMMFNTVLQCGVQMREAVGTLSRNQEAVDIKDASGCYTTDVIGSCAFGLDCDSFKSPDAEFRKYGKKIFAPLSKVRAMMYGLVLSHPSLAKALKVSIYPRDATTFFRDVVKATIAYRKGGSQVYRRDMLQLLIDLQDGDGKSLSLDEIAAQAFVFFIAGFETSSTTMAFCLYELASHAGIQQRVREEIERVLSKYQGELTYDAIAEMKYMQQVIDETLRKYPPLSYITRECVKDYKIPESEAVLEKGTKVLIPILAFHRDPENFPEPESFDPERFSEKNKKNIRPFTYIPFGEGPRLCIGMRFGIMQTKVGLTQLLKKFIFTVNKKTIVPLAMDRYSFILTNEGGIWLDIQEV